MTDELIRIAPNFYGITMVPKESWKQYGFALLTIAGADGDVSDPELEWLTIECAEAVGVEEEIVAEWEEFDYDLADLQEIFHSFNSKSYGNFNKLLIYDAIRMSSADGAYTQEEKDCVHETAKILKVNKDTVMAIESLVDLEHAANKLRLTIL